MHLYEDLEGICEVVSEKLADANEKMKGSQGKLTSGDLEYLDMLTHVLKSVKTTMAMMESESNNSMRGSYEGGSYNSYDGGMSRRSYEGRSGRGRYSGRMYRDTGMINELRSMMQQTDDEHTREEFQRFIEKMEHM